MPFSYLTLCGGGGGVTSKMVPVAPLAWVSTSTLISGGCYNTIKAQTSSMKCSGMSMSWRSARTSNSGIFAACTVCVPHSR